MSQEPSEREIAADIYTFFKLRLSQRRDLAKQFDLAPGDPTKSDLDRGKDWLMEAKAKGKLVELLAAAADLIRK